MVGSNTRLNRTHFSRLRLLSRAGYPQRFRVHTNTMIEVKVIPDKQRFAVLRDGRECRLVGPGLILIMKWPGRKYFPISIGDRGRLVTSKQAQFGEVLLSVEIQTSSPSTAVRVVGLPFTLLIKKKERSYDKVSLSNSTNFCVNDCY
jgi:hypothetical protein